MDRSAETRASCSRGARVEWPADLLRTKRHASRDAGGIPGCHRFRIRYLEASFLLGWMIVHGRGVSLSLGVLAVVVSCGGAPGPSGGSETSSGGY
jgi:hypothetical protein